MSRLNRFRSYAYFYPLIQINSRKFSQSGPKLPSFKDSKVLSAMQAGRESLKKKLAGGGGGEFRSTNFSHICWGRGERKTPQNYANIFKMLGSSTTLQDSRLHFLRALPERQNPHKLNTFHAQRAPDSSLSLSLPHIWKRAP